MAGQDNLTSLERSSLRGTRDADAFLEGLDTKSTWVSDAFPAAFSGHEGARQFLKLYVTAFPDLHLDIEQIGAAGWRQPCGGPLALSRNPPRPLADVPAIGRKASNHGCTVMEVKNNKVGHAFVYFDNVHLLRQIGVLPGSCRGRIFALLIGAHSHLDRYEELLWQLGGAA